MLTQDQMSKLKKQLEQSEAMHHKIMAKMADPKFNLLEIWEQKERIDLEIGGLIRATADA